MNRADPITHAARSSPATTGGVAAADAVWVVNAELLWANRHTLVRVAALTFVLAAIIAFSLPNQYESSTQIMPPEQTGSSAAMLAALVGKSPTPGGLAGLAGGLLGGRSNGAIFVSLLRSGTVSGHLIERFQLQQVYHKRYLEDTGKMLAHKTTIAEDPKSGVISIVVEDKDRGRARDLAQGYVDELNALVARVDTSSAHREREFIEQRLRTVDHDLQQAQIEMSEFSTAHAAIDIKEQTRAMVDSDAKLQGQLVASESELDSLQQIYGDQNARVRAAEARVGVLRRELARESNGSDPASPDPAGSAPIPYPALRQLPALAVPWENLYRRVRIHETVYELLSAQYETARIEEAKSIPTVSVIDPAGWPEKKSSPHRLTLVLAAMILSLVATSLFLLAQRSWGNIDDADPRKALARSIVSTSVADPMRFRGGRP